jgi:hypothetical protein
MSVVNIVAIGHSAVSVTHIDRPCFCFVDELVCVRDHRRLMTKSEDADGDHKLIDRFNGEAQTKSSSWSDVREKGKKPPYFSMMMIDDSTYT